jgi:hypothetical protein
MNIQQLLNSYPRVREPLPASYDEIYLREYLINREGGTLATRMSALLESWMHRQVSKKFFPGNRVLEIGAGTLNHLRYETPNVYDVVEPFEELVQG